VPNISPSDQRIVHHRDAIPRNRGSMSYFLGMNRWCCKASSPRVVAGGGHRAVGCLAAVLVVVLRGSSEEGDISARRKPAAGMRTWRAGNTLVMLGTRRLTAYDVDSPSRNTRWPISRSRSLGATHRPRAAAF
jgi:hypothetical protein